MHEQITLKFSTSCYMKFNFVGIMSEEKSLKTYVELFLPQELNSTIRPSEERLVYIEDLLRLCDYLEKHIADQQVPYPEESYTFTTYELIFAIQALTGRVKSNTEGNSRSKSWSTSVLIQMLVIGCSPDSKQLSRWPKSGTSS